MAALDAHRPPPRGRNGLQRVAADDQARTLNAGTPQGCPASPMVGCIVVDFALAHARAEGGQGYDLDGVRAETLGFADNLAAVAGGRVGEADYGAELHSAQYNYKLSQRHCMGAISVRFNTRKLYYACGRLPPSSTVGSRGASRCMPSTTGAWRRATMTVVRHRGETCWARRSPNAERHST